MTNDFKPLAVDGAANVVSQAVFLALLGGGGALEHGFQDGLAITAQFNKILRQTSVMVAAMGQTISDQLGVDVLDDGDLAGLITKLKAALINSAWTTGDTKLTYKAAADAGWIMMNDGTIGSATSGATTRANADCLALFTLWWNNTAGAVSGGRGASAAADWAANKTIALPKILGRSIAIAGAGAGLTARALGAAVGSEDAVLIQHNHGIVDPGHNHGVNDPTHQHTTTRGGSVSAGTGGTPAMLYAPGVPTDLAGTGIYLDASGTNITINNAGAGTGVGLNMPPEGFMNVMAKL